MVEGARLESVCALSGTVGSNPTLSARIILSPVIVILYAPGIRSITSLLGEQEESPAQICTLIAKLYGLAVRKAVLSWDGRWESVG